MIYMKMMRTPNEENGRNGDVRVEVSPLYDLILSLFMAGSSGIEPRPSFLRSWKSRLSQRGRKAFRFFFESEEHFGLNALTFALRLPYPRTIDAFLTLLRSISLEDFVVTLAATLEPAVDTLAAVVRKVYHQEPLMQEERAAWEELHGRLSTESLGHLERLLHDPMMREELASLLEEHFTLYYEEESSRLLPALKESAKIVMAMASSMTTEEIISTVARGLVLPTPEGKWITFAPSYYGAPFVFSQESEEEFLLIFPAGLAMARQQAGELKAELLHSLKALADPTRLEILRMLSRRQMYALEISRVLRLSHPTVLHHMASLRVGGFVQTELRKGNNYYALKNDRLGELRLIMEKYLTARAEDVDNDLQQEGNDGADEP